MTSPPVAETLRRHAAGLMALDGVEGVGEGLTPDGRPCVVVFVRRLTAELRARIPGELDGHPVRIEESGEFHALPDSAAGGPGGGR